MWKEILSAIKEIFVLAEKTEQNKESIKELRSNLDTVEEKVERLTSIVEILAHDNLRLRDEIKNAREQEEREREKLALRLENEMLKFERRLPSGESGKEDK